MLRVADRHMANRNAVAEEERQVVHRRVLQLQVAHRDVLRLREVDQHGPREPGRAQRVPRDAMFMRQLPEDLARTVDHARARAARSRPVGLRSAFYRDIAHVVAMQQRNPPPGRIRPNGIVRHIARPQQRRSRRNPQRHAAAQFQRRAHERAAFQQDHATLRRTRIDRLLNGSGVLGRAVAPGAHAAHVADRLCRQQRSRRSPHSKERQGKQKPAHAHEHAPHAAFRLRTRPR